jgi:CBS domain-containing protein
MTKKVLTVVPETSVEDIRQILLSNRISGVPVVDPNNRVVGIVSESDIVISLIHEEPQLSEKLKDMVLSESHQQKAKPGSTAADIMTSPAITAIENTPLEELIHIITSKRIKRVIIVDPSDQPLGIVSKIDIVKAQSYEKVVLSSDI